ncbi:hypothetical protein CBS101457_004529 [Exobasidium rhododendri]|nr:hypothetical protein CBS101457_004529 [Exobasidium rhododendri]
MKILCVAEKPSIAKSISGILSSGNGLNNRPGKDKYCRNFEFQYRMPPDRNFGARAGSSSDGMIDMVVTSVKGHLMSQDFPESYKKWTSCSPSELFTAPIETFVSKDCKQVAQNLKDEARRADVLMIWTDCDREGEHIGTEVVKVCRQVNPRIEVKRAKFSAIIANQIHRAAQNPVELDWRAAEAVESRMELDLRLGAAFTRLQCLNLQQHNAELQKRVISYGPCQFPTLGFVVDRYIVARDFVSEAFWYISVFDKRQDMEVDFRWSRNHLMDRQAVRAIFQRCQANREATVTKVTSKQTRKFKPSPLTTVELQKAGGRLLRMAPKKVLDVAEKLYQRGILSYPRTETDQYDKDFDFQTLISKQVADSNWGTYASRLSNVEGGAFEKPVNGRKNDQAHPPIHPARHAGDLAGDEKKVYDYITRRFLASCSKHAVGNQTTVDLDIAKEVFTASGVVVLERNYLEIYTFDKWGGPALPQYQQGEHFIPAKMEMKEGETTRPKLLTEADLVSLMDKNGIGTDATIAEHIAKIIEREYVKLLKEGQINYLIPSELGMGLVEGYNAIEFDGNKSLCKPLLRKETEERMTLICQGTRTKEETVQQSLSEYRVVFDKTKQDIGKLIERVGANLRGEYAQGEGHTEVSSATTSYDQETGGIQRRAENRDEPSVLVIDDDDDDDDDDDNNNDDDTDDVDDVISVLPGRREGRNATTVPTRGIPSRATGRGGLTSSEMSANAPSASSSRRTGDGNFASYNASATGSATTHRTTPDVCFTCGESGHWSHACPTRRDASRANGDAGNGASHNNNTVNRSRPADMTCFTCGEGGHWASDCTSNDNQRSSKRPRGALNSRGASSRGLSSRGGSVRSRGRHR